MAVSIEFLSLKQDSFDLFHIAWIEGVLESLCIILVIIATISLQHYVRRVSVVPVLVVKRVDR